MNNSYIANPAARLPHETGEIPTQGKNPLADGVLGYPSRRLAGKVALITGAARGQGRSHALALAAEGADIIAIDICRDVDAAPYSLAEESDLEATRIAVEAIGQRCESAVSDIRDSVKLKDVVSAAVERLGRLDFCIANAGIAPRVEASWERTHQEWEETIGINLTGTWNTTAAAIPHILRTGEGTGAVILVSSMVGLRGAPFATSYSVSKWGVTGMAQSLANELGHSGIRVNSIHPGNVNTEMIDNDMMRSLMSGGKEGATMADAALGLQAMNSLQHPWLEPEDISATVVHLCSPAGRYITGAAIPLDLGGSAKFGT